MKKLLFLLILPIFFGCNKEAQNSVASTPDTFYFKATVNGVTVNWSSESTTGFKANAMSESGVGLLSNDCTNTFCKELDLVARIFTQPIVNAQTSNTIMVAFTQAARAEDFRMIRSWLDLGRRPFGSFRSRISDPVHDGVVIDYTDENGRSWISDLRIADQNGSSFECIELKDADPGKPYQKIWTARFSGKLYSTASCPPNVSYETITVTNAEIRIPVFPK